LLALGGTLFPSTTLFRSWGVKDLVENKLRPIVVGEDPLNVDKLYTKMLMESAGAGAIAGVTVTAASGVEIALWDLAGRILETPRSEDHTSELQSRFDLVC